MNAKQSTLLRRTIHKQRLFMVALIAVLLVIGFVAFSQRTHAGEGGGTAQDPGDGTGSASKYFVYDAGDSGNTGAWQGKGQASIDFFFNRLSSRIQSAGLPAPYDSGSSISQLRYRMDEACLPALREASTRGGYGTDISRSRVVFAMASVDHDGSGTYTYGANFASFRDQFETFWQASASTNQFWADPQGTNYWGSDLLNRVHSKGQEQVPRDPNQSGMRVLCLAVNDDEPEDPAHPAISLVKYDVLSGVTNGDRNTPAQSLQMTENKPVRIGFLIKNTGDVPLTNIQLTDVTNSGTGHVDMSTVSCAPALSGLTLAPNGTVTCEANLSGDTPGVQHTNTATVTGRYKTQTLTDSDPWNGIIPAAPAISLVKYDVKSGVTEGDRNEMDNALVIEGDSTRIGFLITNTGNVALKKLVLTDETTDGVGKVTNITCTPALLGLTLDPGDTVTCEGDLVDVPAGASHTNKATVTGEDPDGKKVTDDDPWNGRRPETPTPPNTGVQSYVTNPLTVVALGITSIGLLKFVRRNG